MTDAELVVRARAGETGSFAELVGRYHGNCLRFARHLLGDPEDAEEVVQEALLRAYHGLGAYRERDSFRAWLFRILVNRCRSAARRRQARNDRLVRDEGAVERAAVNGEAGLVDVQRTLLRALAGLDALHREAFLLRVGEEMEYEEIARLTGVRTATLRMRVKRARDHVRAHWEGGEHA